MEKPITVNKLAQELNQQENRIPGKRVSAYDENNNRYLVTGWIEGTNTDPELCLTIKKVDSDVQALGKRVKPDDD